MGVGWARVQGEGKEFIQFSCLKKAKQGTIFMHKNNYDHNIH